MVDTEWPSFQAWRRFYTERGATLALSDWVAAVGGDGGFDPIAHLEAQIGQPIDREDVLAKRQAMKAELVRSAPLMEGVRERIAEARELGWAVGVASSSDSAWVEGHLTRLGMLDKIDAVRTRDYVSRVKPSPEVFQKAAEALAIAPEACVVCEDSLNGVRAARAAGMFVVAIPNRVTQAIDFSEAHLRVDSLSELSLAALRWS